MKICTIIPARGGSKGVPGKNKYPILGKPLINYTIESALDSLSLTDIIVSSDDESIKEIVLKYPSIIFHKRSDNISRDESPINETIEAILNEYNSDNKYEAILLLQPTSPIRSGNQIDEAIKIFESNNFANSLISVCSMDDIHPARMYWKNNIELIPIFEEYEHARRQDIPTVFFRNGSIYITKVEAFKKEKKIMAKPSISYLMPSSQLLNIDNPRDILIAEVLIKQWINGAL